MKGNQFYKQANSQYLYDDARCWKWCSKWKDRKTPNFTIAGKESMIFFCFKVGFILPSTWQYAIKLSTELLTELWALALCVEGLERIPKAGQTQDFKMGSFNVPHLLITRQSCPCVCTQWWGGMSWSVSVYCDKVGCHALWHGIPVWQHLGKVPLLQAGTVTI